MVFSVEDSTAVRLSWSGSVHLSTCVRYTVHCSLSGVIISVNERVLPPGVNSTVVVLDDDITFTDVYVHNFTLYYIIKNDVTSLPGPQTTAVFTFGTYPHITLLLIMLVLFLIISQIKVTSRFNLGHSTSALIGMLVRHTQNTHTHTHTHIHKHTHSTDRHKTHYFCTHTCFYGACLSLTLFKSLQVKKTAGVRNQLQSYLIQVIHKQCSDCYDLTPSFLRPGIFLCHGNPTRTTYRSTLVNPFPTTTAARLVGIIQSWVSTNAAFILDDLLVRVPPHISLQFPHTSHYSSPTHLTTVPPHISLQFPTHISLQFPHTSHYSTHTHLTIVSPHISL